MGLLRRIDRDDAEQRGRLLLHRDALPLHLLRQLGERDLHAVVDVDGVDVGIGAELERHQQRIAAVIAADALHVDHLVDADDLRLDRLGDRGLDDQRRMRRDRRRSPRPAAARCPGYCAIGIASSDTRPAIVVTIAMTIASRGRSTKMADNTAQPATRGLGGRSRHDGARPQALRPLDDDHLAAGQPFQTTTEPPSAARP